MMDRLIGCHQEWYFHGGCGNIHVHGILPASMGFWSTDNFYPEHETVYWII